MPTYTCPGCRNSGEPGIPEYQPGCAFEIRGQAAGKHVFKCQKCGAGLAKLGLFSKKLTLIAPDDWGPMEREWNRRFG